MAAVAVAGRQILGHRNLVPADLLGPGAAGMEFAAARPARQAGHFAHEGHVFAPAVGINEDPVTGSAHCTLAPYWGAKLGKQELVGWQASRRGGRVHMRLAGERVVLGGQARMISKGELLV